MNGLKWVTHDLYGTANPNIMAAGTVPLFKAPTSANGGGITIREVVANVQSGTATLVVADLGASGTAAPGTICALAIAQTTRAPFVGTPAGYYVAAGNYVGVVYPVGTVVPPANIAIGFLDGK